MQGIGGRTFQEAFLSAFRRNHDSCAIRLIDTGVDVNSPVSEDQTPLQMAVHGYRYHLIKALINAGANVNVPVWDGTPILLAAADSTHNDAEMFVRLLINSGANVNMTNNDGSTALIRAAYRGTSPAVVTALINAGADVNILNS